MALGNDPGSYFVDAGRTLIQGSRMFISILLAWHERQFSIGNHAPNVGSVCYSLSIYLFMLEWKNADMMNLLRLEKYF